MPSVPKKVVERLSKQLTVFQKILRAAKDRDVSESDTVTIINYMLADLFGFDKYTDITSEQEIKGQYCDLAVKYEGVIKYLIEVKAIGLTLKASHLTQVRNYGANKGIPWVVLTNGIDWEVYQIKFARPIDCVHTCSFNILEMSGRKREDIDRLYILCKEGIAKSALKEFHEHAQNVNRFVLAAVIQCDNILDDLRREVRRVAGGASISIDEIASLLPEVLKREVIEGESAKEAEKRVRKAASKRLHKKAKKTSKAKSSTAANG